MNSRWTATRRHPTEMQRSTRTITTTGKRPGQSKQPKSVTTTVITVPANKSKNTNRQKTGRQRQISSNRNAGGGGIASLSQCAADYAIAVSDPFHPRALKACLPKWPAPDSVRSIGRFVATGTTNVNGYGAVILCPSLANNATSGYYTTLGSDSTLSNQLIPTTAGITSGAWSAIQLANTPQAQVANLQTDGSFGYSGRIISVGLKVTFKGTVNNSGGTVFSYVSRNHATMPQINTQINPNVVSRRDLVYGVTSQLELSAVTETETDYSTWNTNDTSNIRAYYPYMGTNTNATFDQTNFPSVGPLIAGIWLNSAAPSQPFMVEIILHAEYIGDNLPGLQPHPDSDNIGFQKVASASSRMPALQSELPSAKPIGLMDAALRESAKFMGRAGASFMQSYGSGARRARGDPYARAIQGG